MDRKIHFKIKEKKLFDWQINFDQKFTERKGYYFTNFRQKKLYVNKKNNPLVN